MDINKVASAILKHSPNMDISILLKILDELEPLPDHINHMTDGTILRNIKANQNTRGMTP